MRMWLRADKRLFEQPDRTVQVRQRCLALRANVRNSNCFHLSLTLRCRINKTRGNSQLMSENRVVAGNDKSATNSRRDTSLPVHGRNRQTKSLTRIVSSNDESSFASLSD